jgi:hypothetical protein
MMACSDEHVLATLEQSEKVQPGSCLPLETICSLEEVQSYACRRCIGARSRHGEAYCEVSATPKLT